MKADAVGIIVAAGSGKRMGGVSKPLIKLGKETLYEHVLAAFAASSVERIVAVCSKDNIERISELSEGKTGKTITVVYGGETRSESVYLGVKAAGDCELVCVHDCARPFVTAEMIDGVISSAREVGAATACTQVTDTVKFVDNEHGVIYTPARKYLLSVQTPQCFKKSDYLPAFLRGAFDKKEFTDESAMLENYGVKVAYVDCGRSNMKLTTKEDIMLAKAIKFLNDRSNEK